jgi:hypothetical protein
MVEWWCTPIIPVTPEAESGESLLAQEFEACLGNIAKKVKN